MLGPDVFEKLFRRYGPQAAPGELEFPEIVWPHASPKVPSLETNEQTDIRRPAESDGAKS